MLNWTALFLLACLHPFNAASSLDPPHFTDTAAVHTQYLVREEAWKLAKTEAEATREWIKETKFYLSISKSPPPTHMTNCIYRSVIKITHWLWAELIFRSDKPGNNTKEVVYNTSNYKKGLSPPLFFFKDSHHLNATIPLKPHPELL